MNISILLLQIPGTADLVDNAVDQVSSVSPLNTIGYSLLVLFLVVLLYVFYTMMQKERKYSEETVDKFAALAISSAALAEKMGALSDGQKDSRQTLQEIRERQTSILIEIKSISDSVKVKN